MANVTDSAFRRMIAKYGKPDVMYTEFVSADGLILADEEGRQKLLRDLVFTSAERPIVAQFFTSKPVMIEKAAALAAELGFDGIDINMGCPDKTVEKQGAGSKLILNPGLAAELVTAAKRGAPNLPVSVKTRIGYNKDILEEWLPKVIAMEPAAIILHARTRKEMSKVPARWDRVQRAVEIRDALGSVTRIVGNGDVKDMEDAHEKITETGADGAMIGRAIFGTPWLFRDVCESVLVKPLSEKSSDLLAPLAPSTYLEDSVSVLASGIGLEAKQFASSSTFLQEVLPTLFTRLRIAIEHAKLFEELLGDIKNFALMKKHFKAYVEGFSGAKELRMQLMETKNATQVEEIIEKFIKDSDL